MVQRKDEWLKVDDNQAVLFEMKNKWDQKTGKSLYRIGFRSWLLLKDMKEASDQQWVEEMARHGENGDDLRIMWPIELNVVSAEQTLAALLNVKVPLEFETTVVKILGYGDMSDMKRKLVNVVKMGVINPTKEDRRVAAEKHFQQDYKGKRKVGRPAKKNDTNKAKTIVSRSSDEKQAVLDQLASAKAARRALLEVKIKSIEIVAQVYKGDNDNVGISHTACIQPSRHEREGSEKDANEVRDSGVVMPQISKSINKQAQSESGDEQSEQPAINRKRIRRVIDDDSDDGQMPSKSTAKANDDDAVASFDSEDDEQCHEMQEFDDDSKLDNSMRMEIDESMPRHSANHDSEDHHLSPVLTPNKLQASSCSRTTELSSEEVNYCNNPETISPEFEPVAAGMPCSIRNPVPTDVTATGSSNRKNSLSHIETIAPSELLQNHYEPDDVVDDEVEEVASGASHEVSVDTSRVKEVFSHASM
ncbi:hypothetical protein QAD02_012766 [Eretmocerus hayati]|uniref:Uncharacterized protein n=1 Tax=Eretmocerus hayati TaxID=131215 RepID=A0ACC2P0Y0_9HYME|nr:hypothetical protein QAD02_012766 [Eretmocerus hayati]